MTEFRFHHLERQRVDQALAKLLERALDEDQRVVVQAGSQEEVEALDERLWTYSDESFLPHGSKRDGEPETQPIYLTDEVDTPNGASLRVLVSGADPAPFVLGPHALIIILFDGRDEAARARARQQWTGLKAAGGTLSYWREGDDGGWVKGR